MEFIKIAVPQILMLFARYIINFIDIAFLGHLNHDKNYVKGPKYDRDANSTDFLAAVSYSNIWIYLISVPVISGTGEAFLALAA